MFRKIVTVYFIILSLPTFAQNNPEEFKINFGGYINWTAIYDSRQVVAARENHFLLYPKAEQLNINGEDINAIENFQMSVIQTRLSSKVSGFSFLGAKSSGLIEAEFMGNSDADVNGFRIRHAYINLNWNSVNLLVGQFWIPLFVTDIFPDQIGSNGGAPFQPFGRNPQIRLTYQKDSFKSIFALVSQRDYLSSGPNGSSPDYLRNAILPDFHLQFQYSFDSHLFGIGGEFKQLKPGSKTGSGYTTTDKLSSFTGISYLKLGFAPFTFKVEGIYGSNLTDYTMLGGYAVSSIDTVNKLETFTPVKTFSLWTDIAYGTPLEFAVFAGYTKNLGSDDQVTGAYYSRGFNIDNVLRIAPRVQYKEGNTKVSFECEYTSAAYGTPDNYGKVNNTKQISNLRVYTSVFYYINF